MKKMIFGLLLGLFSFMGFAQTGTETIDYSSGNDKGAFTINQIRGSQNTGTVTSVSGNGTGGATVTVATGTTTPVVSVALSAIPNASLANSSVTVAGKTVALGGTTTLAFGDLTGAVTLAQLPTAIPNGNLANASMNIEGQTVALGGSYVAGSTTAAATGTDVVSTKLVRCNPVASDIVRTLPASPPDGFLVTYKRVNASAFITSIVPNSGQTLSEGTQVRLLSVGRCVQFQYNAAQTQWQLID